MAHMWAYAWHTSGHTHGTHLGIRMAHMWAYAWHAQAEIEEVHRALRLGKAEDEEEGDGVPAAESGGGAEQAAAAAPAAPGAEGCPEGDGDVEMEDAQQPAAGGGHRPRVCMAA